MSQLIRDYKRTKQLPDVDVLLDWRLRLVEMKGDYKEGDDEMFWLDNEIKAVDELLSKIK